MAGAAFVDLNTNTHATAGGTQANAGRSGGFSVNYAGTTSTGTATPTWVYIGAALAVAVWLYRGKKG